MVSNEKSDMILFLVPLDEVFPPLASFQTFFLSLVFFSFNMICLQVDFFLISTAWCSVKFRDLWFGFSHWLCKIFSHYYFKHFFWSILSWLSDIPIMHALHLLNCPMILGYTALYLFFFFFFLLCFPVWEVLLYLAFPL